MTTTAEVLQFPKSAIVRDLPQRNEQLEALKEKGTINYANDLAADLVEDMVLCLESCGIETNTIDFVKSTFLLQKILEATVHKSLGLQHPVQKFIDETVSVFSEDGQDLQPLDEDEEDDEIQPS